MASLRDVVSEYQDDLGQPPWSALYGHQAQLGVCPCPISKPPEQALASAVQLYPYKGASLVAESPGLYKSQRLLQLRECGPQKEYGVFVCKLLHRQSPQFLGGHRGIMLFCCATPTLGSVLPRRVGINDGIPLHRLNISRTTRSEPFTRPVSMSILKISCPIYSQAIVTGGREPSAAGAEPDRKAEYMRQARTITAPSRHTPV